MVFKIFNNGNNTRQPSSFSLLNREENNSTLSSSPPPSWIHAWSKYRSIPKQKNFFESRFKRLNKALNVKNPSTGDWLRNTKRNNTELLSLYDTIEYQEEEDHPKATLNKIAILEHFYIDYINMSLTESGLPSFLDVGYSLSIIKHYERHRTIITPNEADRFLWFGDEVKIAKLLGVSQIIFNDDNQLLNISSKKATNDYWVMLLMNGLIRFDYVDGNEVLFSRYCLPEQYIKGEV